MLKILVIGQSNVGKTSIVNRFVQNKFEPAYKATIACEFQTKIINLGESEFRIQLWDLVGQDKRIGTLNKMFCRGAMGAICVADITSQESLEAAISWKDQVDDCVQLKDGSQIPMILFVNKFDTVKDLQED
jgi:small GTP-binding protein